MICKNMEHRYKHGVKSLVERGYLLTPIIAKGVVYSPQNQRASKSATYNRKNTCAGKCFFVFL